MSHNETSTTMEMQAIIPISIAALWNAADGIKPRGSKNRVAAEVMLAVGTWWLVRCIPPIYSYTGSTITPYWEITTYILCQWPSAFQACTGRKPPQPLVNGGPLGGACAKLIQVFGAVILWRMVHEEWPTLKMGRQPTWKEWIVVVVFCGLVNLVLFGWSKILDSRGDHRGVQDLSDATKTDKNKKQRGNAGVGADRSFAELVSSHWPFVRRHVMILALAFLNALCEELEARYVWMEEFRSALRHARYSDTVVKHGANIAQAATFGLAHYHGVPSGWTGVTLTFVYGLLLGWLHMYYDSGLLMPIVVHTVADYFIFAVIASRELEREKAS